MSHLIGLVCGVSALWWLWSLYALVRSVRALPSLPDDRSPAPAQWSRVSLIVAARNEARDLERGVRTRLADDYPNLQVVIVEDRSTDDTPAIADRLARDDARVKVVHLTELPDGWLGKLYAMHRGVAVADGAWLLFSDADVEFAPGTLRRALARCEHEGRDHLAVIPQFAEHGLAVDATLDTFCHLLFASGRLWRVSDPTSSAAVGGGMFNLVRRSVYDRTPGFEWLRREIADDIALGQMLKKHGARPLVMNAVGAVKLEFYKDLGEMAYGLEKSAFAVMARFSYAMLAVVVVVSMVAEAGLFAGFAHPSAAVRLVAGAALATACAHQVMLARWTARSVLPALLFPFGMASMMFMAARSGWLAWRRGGIAWRGTLYRIDDLRAGRRIEVR